MSSVSILTPVVVAAWPVFSAVVAAAATSMGYTVVADVLDKVGPITAATKVARRVELQIANTELVTDQLGRDQHIAVTRGGVTVTFSRDARGHAQVCVNGVDETEEALRAVGEELSQRVVQQYVYQRLIDECRARQFLIVEEEVEADKSIRLKVRHWEG
ncbi:MAG TPA: DUF1257 domain-containing protein [Verrucomicrobiae bacterium]|nr:DUF1257 domain-containing protein [Verrucomicrobiae bacterium]